MPISRHLPAIACQACGPSIMGVRGGSPLERGGAIAIIDVGSNSVRLLVARALSPFAFEVIDEERFDARIGEGQDFGEITPDGMARGLRALSIMAQVARSHQPESITVAGTEALRRAGNSSEFVERAHELTGLHV